MTTTATIIPHQETIENKYRVPSRSWNSWDARARELFNYLYFQGTENNGNVYAGVKRPADAVTDALIRVGAYNLAWLAAEFINEKKQHARRDQNSTIGRQRAAS